MDQNPNTDQNLVFKQISWWKRAALTFPSSALAFVIFFLIFGFSTFIDIFLVILLTSVATVSVMWWWWAMYTINLFSTMLLNASKNLEEFKTEIKKIKEDL